jgi:hypothetical protein
MKTCVVVGMVVGLLILSGCKKETSDERLVGISVSQKKQEQRIERLENTLTEIKQSLDKIGAATGSPAPAEGKEGQVADFRETPEYGQIMAALSALQQAQQEMAQRVPAQQGGPAQDWRRMNDPQEMDKSLGLLAQNFAPKIADPVKRQQFEADVAQLRANLSKTRTTQELYQQLTASLTERLNNEQDERARQFLEMQLATLETGSAEELEARLQRYQRTETTRQLRELQQTYNIPRQTLRDAGIPAMGPMGGPPGGFGPGGGM